MEDGVIFRLPIMGKFITSVPLLPTINPGVQLQNDSRVDGAPVKVMYSEFAFNWQDLWNLGWTTEYRATYLHLIQSQ